MVNQIYEFAWREDYFFPVIRKMENSLSTPSSPMRGILVAVTALTSVRPADLKWSIITSRSKPL